MAMVDKTLIQEQLKTSTQRMVAVRLRKETERVAQAQQEAEPRQPPAVDLSRR